MTMPPDTRNPSGVQSSSFTGSPEDCLRAASIVFQVHQALIKAEVSSPSLTLNPLWSDIRADTYEMFERFMVGTK